jgi:hypothetical protein
MRAIAGLLASLALLLSTGCAERGAREASGGEPMPQRASADASACTASTMDSQRCRDMRASVIAAAGDRESVIERALDWVDDGVAFDRTRTHYGFRADCSGFVAMAWGESMDLSGGDLPEPMEASKPLANIDDLQPGDALSKGGHIVLFGAWANDARDSAIVIEQPHDGVTTMRDVPRSYMSKLTPVRSKLFDSRVASR